MKTNLVPCTGFEPWSLHSAVYYVFGLSSCHWATPAGRITPFKCSCLSATERRTTAAKRGDLHSKSLFLVKNKGQWNAKSGPKAAYGNFAMRTKFSERLDSKWEHPGRNWSNCAHWHTSTHTTAAKLVVRMVNPACGLWTQHTESYTSLRARTDAYKFSFLPRSIRAWNGLPQEIITIQNPHTVFDLISVLFAYVILGQKNCPN